MGVLEVYLADDSGYGPHCNAGEDRWPGLVVMRLNWMITRAFLHPPTNGDEIDGWQND